MPSREGALRMSGNRAPILMACLLVILSTLQPPTLAQIAQVEKTGQATSFETGDDGDLQRGVVLPNPRFTDNGEGTVTDNLTGLIWLKNANCAAATMTWSAALDFANTLFDGSTTHNGGDCSLTDGSMTGDWRLPNVKELRSLIHPGFSNPALSNASGTAQWTEGDAFSSVQSAGYWSSTTKADLSTRAWSVRFHNGRVETFGKLANSFVWPVRGGQ